MCILPPDQGEEPQIKSLDDECKETSITWNGAASCAPLTKTELECLDNDGNWRIMPEVAATATQITVKNELWTQSPFNLVGGSKLYCRYRSMSKSRWGWGIWSTSNSAFVLPDCSPPTLEVVEEKPVEEDLFQADMPCACNASCKIFGCGDCCNKNTKESFWNKVAQKGCCATGACKCGKPQPVPAMSLSAQKHEHKYCHVDSSPQFVKKTKWVTKTVTGKSTVLVPREKKVMETIMVKKIQHVPDVIYGPTEVITNKQVMQPVMNKISTPVTKTRSVQKAVTTYKNEAYKTMETREKKTTVQKKMVRMVPKIVAKQVLEWTESVSKVQKSRWVSKPQMVSNQVPTANLAANCPCFEENCDCAGQDDCNCCFPKCNCAPNMMS